MGAMVLRNYGEGVTGYEWDPNASEPQAAVMTPEMQAGYLRQFGKPFAFDGGVFTNYGEGVTGYEGGTSFSNSRFGPTIQTPEIGGAVWNGSEFVPLPQNDDNLFTSWAGDIAKFAAGAAGAYGLAVGAGSLLGGAGGATYGAGTSALDNVAIDGVVGGNLGANAYTGGTIADVGTGLGSINPSLQGMLGGTAPAMGTAGATTIGEAVQAVQAAAASGAYTGPQAEAIIQALGASGSVSTPLSMLPMQALSGVSSAIKSATGFDVTPGQLLTGGASVIGGLLSGQAKTQGSKDFAQENRDIYAQMAEAAKFKPFGLVATDPRIKAQQAQIFNASQGMLNQFTQSPQTTAPMGTAAQRAMSLGNQYLAIDPQAQAQKYYNDQQALMATGRARDQAGMLSGEFNRGTYGLATGATGQMGAANPRMEAMYNAQRQQDLGLAAAATQGGMDYAKFGTGMVGAGGGLLRDQYGTQVASGAPWQTALGMGTSLEGDAGGTSANLLGQGMLNAAQAMQPANSYSPWGTALMGGANAISGWQNQTAAQQQQTRQDQMLMAMLGNRPQQQPTAAAAPTMFAPQPSFSASPTQTMSSFLQENPNFYI